MKSKYQTGTISPPNNSPTTVTSTLNKAQGDELTLLERLRQKISIESSGRSRYALAIARAAADLTAALMVSVPQPSIPVDSSLAVTEDVVHESWHDERAWQARRLEECLLGHA